MIWIGLIVGVALGASIWGFEGAVVLGFLGWLIGVIVKARRRGEPTPVSSPATKKETLEVRVARLEATVARLERQLGNSGTDHLAASVSPGESAAPAQPAVDQAQPDTGEARAPADTPPPIPGPTQPPPIPTAPPPPPRPNPIVAWFTGGNTIARVGIVILFFGLAFLLKYAADNQMLPPELRVAGVAAGGIALLVLGWRLRVRRTAYALGLQGAGVAVLYLTTFAALRLYDLLPPEIAFALLAVIALASAVLAIAQDAAALAVIGAGGGFLAPILASSGGGSHVMLFSYYLVLNAGIAFIAWRKAWRSLNVTGFVFTLLIGALWGERYYRPELFDTTEPFLIAFFLVYVLIAVLVARETAAPKARYVDSTLVFGVPLAAIALQAGMMRDSEYGLAITSLAAAAFYLVLAWQLFRTGRESWRLLAQSFLALGIVFATLTIPLALDARWTSASWALEGAAVVWIGLRQKRTLARAFGYLLQVGAGVAYVEGYRHMAAGYPLVDAAFVGAMLIALAGLWTHRLLLTGGEAVHAVERKLVAPLYLWGLAWLLFAGLDEIDAHVPGRQSLPAAVAFLAGVALVFGELGKRWAWIAAAWTARALMPVLWLAAFITLLSDPHLFARGGWVAWLFALAALGWTLRTVTPEVRSRYTTLLHAGAVLLAAFVGSVELHWLAAHTTSRGTAWSIAAVVVAPALLAMLIASRRLDGRWPVGEHPRAYRWWACGILALGFGLWSLFANFTHDGRSDPLPYLPLLNALDLAHILAGLAAASAWLATRRSGLAPKADARAGIVVVGALAFVWLNGILLRTLSHWAGIPYTTTSMMPSVLVQASLSIFWAVLALVAMVYATRTARRPLWMVGAALMAVVVAKLFVVDLANVGGIERIVSFIGVGVLMLVIGYFSPVPPRKPESAAP